MTLVWLMQFAASLLIVGTGLRYIEMRWPESWLGRSLAVVY